MNLNQSLEECWFGCCKRQMRKSSSVLLIDSQCIQLQIQQLMSSSIYSHQKKRNIVRCWMSPSQQNQNLFGQLNHLPHSQSKELENMSWKDKIVQQCWSLLDQTVLQSMFRWQDFLFHTIDHMKDCPHSHQFHLQFLKKKQRKSKFLKNLLLLMLLNLPLQSTLLK